MGERYHQRPAQEEAAGEKAENDERRGVLGKVLGREVRPVLGRVRVEFLKGTAHERVCVCVCAIVRV